ncbi:hypothetical protein MICRO11B_200004 [Micrococcus luteus]|nr:hypothetical protein MICRO11B_200004 [Micrococcus luteus]
MRILLILHFIDHPVALGGFVDYVGQPGLVVSFRPTGRVVSNAL